MCGGVEVRGQLWVSSFIALHFLFCMFETEFLSEPGVLYLSEAGWLALPVAYLHTTPVLRLWIHNIMFSFSGVQEIKT